MKEIPLTKGKTTIVDDEDYEYLNQFKWHLLTSGIYAARKFKGQRLLMHRVIMSPENDLVVDHINHNGLDNRKENLRICSRADNCKNQLPKSKAFVNVKGVKLKNSGKFEAAIRLNYKTISIGTFDTIEMAGIAYDIKAKELFGEFAYLNFPFVSEEKINLVQKILNNPKKKSGTSMFRGVYRKHSKWCSSICIKGQSIRLGSFVSEKEAVLAYNEAAIKYHGEKAKLNVIK